MTDAEIQALLARAMPRDRVILATAEGIEREDVMVIPKEDWVQLCIWLAAASPASRGAPTPAMIDAAARALWVMGNARIGARTWESVASHYRQEAEAALRAALTAPEG